ncbi:hypothetical protein Dda_3846 [Drechslerella dactyloides]|uniref:Uncharacterized protein n=1 Tax=Drechslerella dactyloides TaxID=74499 RepID=A0AAD6IYN5_DREDA|nr:hypothetical protein Dda_3846 [Drechslerella dactyloides]
MDIFTTQHYRKYNSLPCRRSFDIDVDTDTDSEKTLLGSSRCGKDDFSSVTDTDSSISECSSLYTPWRTPSIQTCLTLLNLSLLLGSAFCYYQTFYSGRGLNEELKAISYYSPLLDIIDVPIRTERINGTLFPGPNPSIYRLPPSPEVDAAWESVAEVVSFPITSSAVKKLGKDPSTAVRLPESLGFPPDTHIALLDTAHQIHCLNALRKAVFSDHYRDKAKEMKKNRLHWVHLSHCAGVLLQNLMCQATLDVVTLNWVETQRHPFPDFSVNKQCRDYSVLQRWQQENRISEEVLNKLVRVAEGSNYVELPSPAANMTAVFEDAATPWDFDWMSM